VTIDLQPLPIRYGRDTCGDADRAEALEWLVTNGIGGFASGSVAGPRTRRYHGLLVAALDPPAARTVMAAEAHESLILPQGPVPLYAVRWRGDVLSPRGFEHLEAFWLEGRTPVWRYVLGEVALEKRISMVPGRNATVLRYRLIRGDAAVRIEIKVLAAYRDFHATTRAGGWRMLVDGVETEIRVQPFDGARPLRIQSDTMALASAHSWYEGFLLARERDRGLDFIDDALHVATARAELASGAEVALVLSADEARPTPAEAVREAAAAEDAVVDRFRAHAGPAADPIGLRLALAADQFLVRRNVGGDAGSTVVAGYHWFGDWGRDTMIALPGLTLSAGRPEIARAVLATFARFVDGGMLPNRFPDTAGRPEYNTVDATLWYIEAIRAYVAATGDDDFARELWPELGRIVDAHEQGTRYGIGVDPADGLLRAGVPGVQVTWMDAKVDDRVVTPRHGKCVEVNALWYNALVALADLAGRLGQDARRWHERADRVRRSFLRFWCAGVNHLYDVIDGPDGDDSSLRPNQIFAVSLPASPLDAEHQRAVVSACGAALLTSHGLRTLAPDHPDYRPTYGGGPAERDAAYHQGTVWTWLLGPFALAHHRVHGDAARALSLLEPLADHLSAYAVGSLAEIFDAAPPHRARGCIAQAWSVAETLRAWTILRRAEGPATASSDGRMDSELSRRRRRPRGIR
jgi:predicted glycogen debranching enzyme